MFSYSLLCGLVHHFTFFISSLQKSLAWTWSRKSWNFFQLQLQFHLGFLRKTLNIGRRNQPCVEPTHQILIGLGHNVGRSSVALTFYTPHLKFVWHIRPNEKINIETTHQLFLLSKLSQPQNIPTSLTLNLFRLLFESKFNGKILILILFFTHTNILIWK